MGLNWVDLALGLVVAGNCVLGVKRGIFREAFNLAGIVAGLFAGFRLYEALGWNMEGWLGAQPQVANLVAFLAIFFAIAFGASWVGYVLHKSAKKLFVGWLDRTLGGAFGFARGLIFASVLALACALFPFFPKLEQDLASSWLGPHVVQIAPAVYGFVMEKVRGKGYEGLDLKRTLDRYVSDGDGPDAEGPPGGAAEDGKNAPRKETQPEEKKYYDRGD